MYNGKLLFVATLVAVALLICASPPTATADLVAVSSPGEIPGELVTTFDGVGTGPIDDPYMFYDGGA